MKKNKFRELLSALLICSVVLSACSTSSQASTTASAVTTSATTAAAAASSQSSETTAAALPANVAVSDVVTFDEADKAVEWSAKTSTTIKLNGTSATVTGSGAKASGGSVTISAAGTYVLSGKLSDGQVIIDVQDKGDVHLVLNGVDIHDNDSAGIYIKEAGNVVMTLEEGTENSVSDGETYVFADGETDEPSAAIFSKADLVINGTGKLTVAASYNDGITSKDDLKIVSGTIDITAADDGIVGKDMVAIADGTVTIKVEGDGIKSTNDTDEGRGFIAIADGTFTIEAGNDGIQAETALIVDGGTFNLLTGGGSVNGEVKQEEGPGGMGMQRGGMNATSATGTSTDAGETATATTETETPSTKGLKAGGDVTVNGGTFDIDSADDALHSNSNVTVTGGELEIATGDDGIHADALVTITGGSINITKSYEGIEGANITISGGEAHVVASDDGINVAGGSDETTAGGRADQFSVSSSNLLTISGGYVSVDAAGDGLDSNGSITMTGGTVIVNGPTMNGNGALDYDGTFNISGGTLVAAGSSGMAQATTDTSSQFTISMTYSQTQQAGTLVHLQDSEGNTIMTFAPSKNYQSVVISSPELAKGASYTLYTGGSSAGTDADGMYTDGDYTGGTKVTDFEISSSVTWLNESGVTTASSGGGFGGRGGGGRPQGGGR
ncbi:carbohydrate-binding domain-containing protein [Paenibacillus sp. KS-LC4]|uniref:carbohydrate-binding domain-containing protein n=1 Tax=Paenibacillus sp. KS-LC4 TaxID=2979727 RepID=UPI0030CCA879